jgi:hypothetical protein
MENIKEPDQRWHIQKEKLLLRFSYLNESDFRYDYGMKEVMMCKLQAKLGKSRDELNSLILTL